MKTKLLAALSALAASSLLACQPAPSQPLAQAGAQAGFDFATSRPVMVQMSSTTKQALALSTVAGKLLYAGTLTPGATLMLSLPLATRETALVAELRANGSSTRLQLPISSDQVILEY